MGFAVPHPAANFTFGPPPGDEERVGTIQVRVTYNPPRTRMTSIITVWEFDDAELIEIMATRRVMIHFMGSTLMPHFVAPESIMRQFATDFGSSW